MLLKWLLKFKVNSPDSNNSSFSLANQHSHSTSYRDSHKVFKRYSSQELRLQYRLVLLKQLLLVNLPHNNFNLSKQIKDLCIYKLKHLQIKLDNHRLYHRLTQLRMDKLLLSTLNLSLNPNINQLQLQMDNRY